MVSVYNHEVESIPINVEKKEIKPQCLDEKKIKWSSSLLGRLSRRKTISSECRTETVLFRPFCKQWLGITDGLIHRPAHWHEIIVDGYENECIVIAGKGTTNPFSCFISNKIIDLNCLGGSDQCFPYYWFVKNPDGSVTQVESITDECLRFFRSLYPNCFEYYEASDTKKGVVYHNKRRPLSEGGVDITKRDIFYYVYGILHSSEYRERFAANLQKEEPCIPMVGDSNTFRAFSIAGKKLANLHINYEQITRWNVTEVGDSDNPGLVEKMKWGKKVDRSTGKKINDYSVLIYNSNLTIKDLPEAAQNYLIGGKTALGWIIDRYQVRTDDKSKIVNDPNDYFDNPRYLINLIESVATVSMETISIINDLPKLNERTADSDWTGFQNQ